MQGMSGKIIAVFDRNWIWVRSEVLQLAAGYIMLLAVDLWSEAVLYLPSRGKAGHT